MSDNMTDIDDDEIAGYIRTKDEAIAFSAEWHAQNPDYLQDKQNALANSLDQLWESRERRFHRCAKALCEGDALLICSGAGMGVDSGFATFRGRNAGVWPATKTLRLDYIDICDPVWFEESRCGGDARLGWAFWHFCWSAYTKGSPHRGYEILAEWGQRMKHGLFSATSNVDGHWARTAGVGEDRVYECHGAVTHLQCVEGTKRVWRASADDMAALDVPAWDLAPGEVVEVQEGDLKDASWRACRPAGGEWVRGVVAANGVDIRAVKDGKEEDDDEEEEEEGRVLSVAAIRRPGGPDLSRVTPSSPLPVCPLTQEPARPNVLMFGDKKVSDARIDEQHAKLHAWLNSLPADVRLAVVEVGAGTTIPTMRHLAETVTRRFERATLLRLNWDQEEVPPDLGQRAIGVGGMGALAALEELSTHVDALQRQPVTARLEEGEGEFTVAHAASMSSLSWGGMSVSGESESQQGGLLGVGDASISMGTSSETDACVAAGGPAT